MMNLLKWDEREPYEKIIMMSFLVMWLHRQIDRIVPVRRQW